MSNVLYDALDTGIEGKLYDAACKKVLGNKQVLSYIMKTYILEFKNVDVNDIPQYIEDGNDDDNIEGLNTEDNNIYGSKVEYDVLFKAKNPNEKGSMMYINVEAQSTDDLDYPLENRVKIYGERIFLAQTIEEKYKNLNKVYSIWIVVDHAKKRNNRIEVRRDNRVIYDEGQAPMVMNDDYVLKIVIYLGDEYRGDGSTRDLLYLLFKSDMKIGDKRFELEERYGILKLGEEEDLMCNLSQGIMAKGILQGRAEGIELGKAEGKLTMLVEIVRTLMAKEEDINSVMDLLDVSEDMRPLVIELINGSKETTLE